MIGVFHVELTSPPAPLLEERRGTAEVTYLYFQGFVEIDALRLTRGLDCGIVPRGTDLTPGPSTDSKGEGVENPSSTGQIA